MKLVEWLCEFHIEVTQAEKGVTVQTFCDPEAVPLIAVLAAIKDLIDFVAVIYPEDLYQVKEMAAEWAGNALSVVN